MALKSKRPQQGNKITEFIDNAPAKDVSKVHDEDLELPKIKMFPIKLPLGLHRRLKDIAEEKKLSMHDYILGILRGAVKQ